MTCMQVIQSTARGDHSPRATVKKAEGNTVSSDPFVTMRENLRAQAIKRDALVKRATLGRRLIPGTYATPTYAAGADILSRWDDSQSWGVIRPKSDRDRRLSLVNRVVSRREVKLATLTMSARGGITSEGRSVMRAMLDILARERNPRIALLESGEDVREPHRKTPKRGSVTRRPKLYGLTNGTETRVAPRGSTGNVKHRINPGTQVTMRDHYRYVPDNGIASLRMVKTVGVASHPSASHENYSTAINHVRIHPTEATVRIRMSRVPFAVWSRGDHTRIVPVTDYTQVKDARESVKREARRESAKRGYQAMREATKLALLESVTTHTAADTE